MGWFTDVLMGSPLSMLWPSDAKEKNISAITAQVDQVEATLKGFTAGWPPTRIPTREEAVSLQNLLTNNIARPFWQFRIDLIKSVGGNVQIPVLSAMMEAGVHGDRHREAIDSMIATGNLTDFRAKFFLSISGYIAGYKRLIYLEEIRPWIFDTKAWTAVGGMEDVLRAMARIIDMVIPDFPSMNEILFYSAVGFGGYYYLTKKKK